MLMRYPPRLSADKVAKIATASDVTLATADVPENLHVRAFNPTAKNEKPFRRVLLGGSSWGPFLHT
jgi:hypothetical protein